MSLICLCRSYSCVWKTRPKSRPREHVIWGPWGYLLTSHQALPSNNRQAEFCGVAGLSPTGPLALSSAEWSAPTWGKSDYPIIGKDRPKMVRGWSIRISRFSRAATAPKNFISFHPHRNRFVSFALHCKPSSFGAGHYNHLLTIVAAHKTAIMTSERPLPFIYQFAAGMLPQTQYAIDSC